MHSVDKQPRLAWREVFDAPSVQLSGPRGTGSAQAAAKFRSSAIWLDPGRVVLTPPDETPIPGAPSRAITAPLPDLNQPDHALVQWLDSGG